LSPDAREITLATVAIHKKMPGSDRQPGKFEDQSVLYRKQNALASFPFRHLAAIALGGPPSNRPANSKIRACARTASPRRPHTKIPDFDDEISLLLRAW
jgi:hypothetical protein